MESISPGHDVPAAVSEALRKAFDDFHREGFAINTGLIKARYARLKRQYKQNEHGEWAARDARLNMIRSEVQQG